MSASEISASLPGSNGSNAAALTAWPLIPTETEIYILPDGRVVIADLPAELAEMLAQLGEIELAQPVIGGADV